MVSKHFWGFKSDQSNIDLASKAQHSSYAGSHAKKKKRCNISCRFIEKDRKETYPEDPWDIFTVPTFG